jgi:hypothetical protein
VSSLRSFHNSTNTWWYILSSLVILNSFQVLLLLVELALPAFIVQVEVPKWNGKRLIG